MSRPASAARYRPVRALNRGLVLLQELNRLGEARPAELALAAELDRTTTYRMLATLEELGLVARGPKGDAYVLTPGVKGLSDGFTARDRLTQTVAAHLGALFQKVVWPTDFATFERGAMVIRETTHRFSPYSVHRAMVGQARPLFTSALGRAALAGASPSERARMLEVFRGEHADDAAALARVDALTDEVLGDQERRGYSWAVGGSDGRISAIGVPVRRGVGAAAINLVFFRSAMSVETAAARHLADMVTCAADIEASLREAGLEGATG